MSKPVAYRFKSPLSEEGQWEYGKEPPVGSRWEIEGLYRVQVNVPRTPLEKAAKEMLQSVDGMLRNGEWYQAQERADALRDALSQPERQRISDAPIYLASDGGFYSRPPLNQTLEQQQAEPVAWDNCRSEKQCRGWCGNSACASHWENTTPPRRKPLTDVQIAALLENCIGSLPVAKQLIRAVEAAHNIKGGI